MRQLPFPLSVLSSLLTALYGMFRKDPQEFQFKIRERLRLAGIPILSRILNKNPRRQPTPSLQRELLKKGHLSEAAAYNQDDKNENLSRHAADILGQLNIQISHAAIEPDTCSSSGEEQPRKPQRILFYLTNSLPHTHSGYTERSHKILKSLAEKGVEVHAVTRIGYPLIVGRLPHRRIETIDGVTYERLIPPLFPKDLKTRNKMAVDMLVYAARRFRPDVIQTTTDYKNAIVVSCAANILGIPWIYEVRGQLESTWLSRFPTDQQKEAANSEFYTLAREQETEAMKAASAVISLSDTSKKEMTTRGIDPAKIHVIPNSVDESLIGMKYDQEEIRKELGLPNTTIIGTVTSVVGYEGLDDLIYATETLPNVTCLIVGDGTARPELERLVRDLKLEGRVIFTGHQPRNTIWKWYAALDIFVMPRKSTRVTRVVTPIKPLIAQALGKPVIASDLPALREVTGGLETYVQPESPLQLSRAIIRSERSSRTKHYEWITQRTWSSAADKLSEVFDTLS